VIGVKYTNEIEKFMFGRDFFFTRFYSYSIGDWANISGALYNLKLDNPEVKFYIPSGEFLKKIAPNYKDWGYGSIDPSTYIEVVYKNNPYVSMVDSYEGTAYTDHFRAQLDQQIPLAEKILLRFGYTPSEISKMDCTPKLFVGEDERSKILNITGDLNYGCLLFGSRVNNLKGRWSFDNHLLEQAEKYKDTKVFYYSEFDLEGTDWGELFKNKVNITDLGLSIREQVVLKYLAKFNIGYHAGINDAILGNGKDNIILTPYEPWTETHIRNTKYVFKDGSTKFFE